MNIVYKLTNTSKTEGKRYYIGSKTECNIIDIRNIPTIISLKTGTPYYGSSSSLEFIQDINDGHIFKAEILEEVVYRKDLLKKENDYIIKNNAVDNLEFYNSSYATLNYNYDQEAIANIFGESIKQVANDRSAYSRKRTSANNCGYEHIWEFILYIESQRVQNISFSDIASQFNKKRHFIERKYRRYDIQRFHQEKSRYTDNEELYLTDILLVRDLINMNSSYKYICETLNLTLLTVDFLSDNWDKKPKTCLNASIRGFTQEEFSKIITKNILEGFSVKETAVKYKLDVNTCNRYFLKYIRSNLKISDL